MIPEIGNFALCIAIGIALLLSVYPLWGASRGDIRFMSMARPLTYALFIMIILAYACLTWSFATNDFSVSYVTHNSNSHLPIYYRLAAVWGSHEGSLLLWITLLAFWSLAIALFSRRMPLDAIARVLSIMGMISLGLLLFIVFTSNPFLRTLPDLPLDGQDLNPMLQDVGLIFHPPLLYMGYVGFSVVFCLAIASLLSGQLDTTWARWSRPWTLAAWVFLTLGIVLGSSWAYYELGWGGWWFWDPVENASLMPWLAGTALLHSLAVTEKRASFKAWTVLLAIVTFSLSLLGTFLVRSGILVSVHAFASDPRRGLYILLYLVIVIGGSLLLYAIKGNQIKSVSKHSLFSRESSLLLNNIFLVAAMIVVLLGTLFPLFYKMAGLGSISVGEPFFNSMFHWLMIPFAIILGLGPLIRWRRDEGRRLKKRIILAIIITVIIALIASYSIEEQVITQTLTGLLIAIWIIVLTLMELIERITYRHSFWHGLTSLPRSHWGMVLGHVGTAVLVIGIAISYHDSVEKDLLMHVGDKIPFQNYTITFDKINTLHGSNYTGGDAVFSIHQQQHFIGSLHAQKRYYLVSHEVMTKAAINASIFRDIYIALGEEQDNGAWAVRINEKPFIRWIWAGGIMMAIGGIFSLYDRRYRTRTYSSPQAGSSHE